MQKHNCKFTSESRNKHGKNHGKSRVRQTEAGRSLSRIVRTGTSTTKTSIIQYSTRGYELSCRRFCNNTHLQKWRAARAVSSPPQGQLETLQGFCSWQCERRDITQTRWNEPRAGLGEQTACTGSWMRRLSADFEVSHHRNAEKQAQLGFHERARTVNPTFNPLFIFLFPSMYSILKTPTELPRFTYKHCCRWLLIDYK